MSGSVMSWTWSWAGMVRGHSFVGDILIAQLISITSEMLQLDLKKSNDNLVVHGKLIIYMSTNLTQPASSPPPRPSDGRLSATTSALNTLSMNESTLSVNAAAGASSALSRTPSSHATNTESPYIPMPTPVVVVPEPEQQPQSTTSTATRPVSTGSTPASVSP